MKTALIMEGGAMRGLFTCGVIDVLMREGIAFDGAAGISAGAAFGCNFKSRQIGRALRYNLAYGRDPRYCSVRSLLKTGDLYGADFCYRQIPDELDPFDYEAFRRDPTAFFVGATDVETGRCLFRMCRDGGKEDMLWIRASASMPFVSRPVSVGGHLLLDGGISCAVPYAHMENMGYRRNVLVLTQPKGYRKARSVPAPLSKLLLRRYPAAASALERRREMYNAQMDEIDSREACGASLVIRPRGPLGIRRTESRPEELRRAYEAGVGEAQRRLGEIRRFLTEGGAARD